MILQLEICSGTESPIETKVSDKYLTNPWFDLNTENIDSK